MGVEGAISEVEAVRKAGVSARTLQRFSEAGYLTVQVKQDGSRFYSITQLDEIFGSNQDLSTGGVCSTASVEEDASVKPSCSHDATTYYTPAEPTPMVERVVPLDQSTAESLTSSDKQQQEYARLKNLVALQERILDMKEAEIQDLRSQRDWLKTRVEKLEEKGDRDQVLLLSETQALRQMIGFQQRRTSTLRSLLDWLGLGSSDSLPTLPSNQDMATAAGSQGTIVVNKAANA